MRGRTGFAITLLVISQLSSAIPSFAPIRSQVVAEIAGSSTGNGGRAVAGRVLWANGLWKRTPQATCPADQTSCGGICCGTGQVCTNGQCIQPCPSGQITCGTICCGTGQICSNGNTCINPQDQQNNNNQPPPQQNPQPSPSPQPAPQPSPQPQPAPQPQPQPEPEPEPEPQPAPNPQPTTRRNSNTPRPSPQPQPSPEPNRQPNNPPPAQNPPPSSTNDREDVPIDTDSSPAPSPQDNRGDEDEEEEEEPERPEEARLPSPSERSVTPIFGGPSRTTATNNSGANPTETSATPAEDGDPEDSEVRPTTTTEPLPENGEEGEEDRPRQNRPMTNGRVSIGVVIGILLALLAVVGLMVYALFRIMKTRREHEEGGGGGGGNEYSEKSAYGLGLGGMKERGFFKLGSGKNRWSDTPSERAYARSDHSSVVEIVSEDHRSPSAVQQDVQDGRLSDSSLRFDSAENLEIRNEALPPMTANAGPIAEPDYEYYTYAQSLRTISEATEAASNRSNRDSRERPDSQIFSDQCERPLSNYDYGPNMR